MRRSRAIVSFIARGAAALPLLVYGHGTEFLDARLEVHEGVVELQIVADYGGNPMIANEAVARTALADALRVEITEAGDPKRLDALAALVIVTRIAPDPESPMPASPADPAIPHQLLEARWRWNCPVGQIRFTVPPGSGQSVLFWLHEPGVASPRWSILSPADYTPSVTVPARKGTRWWNWAIAAVISLGIAWGWRRATQR